MARFIIALMVLVAVVLSAASANSNTECSGKEQQWHICGRLCEPSCSNPKPNPRFCPRIECTPSFTGGCRCKPGYVRLNKSDCVKQEDCP